MMKATPMNNNADKIDQLKSDFFDKLVEHFIDIGINRGLTFEEIYELFPKEKYSDMGKGLIDAFMDELMENHTIVIINSGNLGDPSRYTISGGTLQAHMRSKLR